MDEHQEQHKAWHEAQRRERMLELMDEHAHGHEHGHEHSHGPRSREARLDHMRAHMQGRNTPRQEEIVEAALDLLDTGGLSAVSLREIAKRLNIRAPALYWYFKNKEDLVDYMAQAILQKGFADLRPRETDEPWQDWLRAQMVRLRKAMLAYTDGGRVVAGAHFYPATMLSELFEQTLASLQSAGLDLRTAYHIAVTATRYTFGYVIEEQASPTPEEMAHIDVKTLLEPYPLSMQVVTELETAGIDEDADFAVGLGYILKGSSGA
jgi:TetR/AcrR family tetracycline transcriptional repressor